MKYRLGQVLYIVLKKETRIYPMQVIEIQTKTTLEGEVISYMVRGGTNINDKLFITDVDGEIFDSAEKAKSELTERATSSIERMVALAMQKAKEWYPNSFEAPVDDPMVLLKKPTTKITPSKPKHFNMVSDLAAEFQREADELSAKEENVVTLSDGTKAKVRSVKLPDTMA